MTMKKQVTILQRWIEIDGNCGTTFVPFDVVYSTQNSKTLHPSKSDVADYYDGNDVYSVDVVDGYGARLSMPGYMDCTEWSVYATAEQAYESLVEMYDDDFFCN